MRKLLDKTDLIFIASLTIGMLAVSIFLFTYPYLYDEAFYASIPYRLANGDSLIQHEWHLSQFSSLFSYLPVQIWLAIKGSSEGIIVFLRCTYFFIHTAITIFIYKYFKEYNYWSIVASMIFFTQVPYRLFAISYNSMFVIFTLFFVLSLLSIYKQASKKLYIISGFCFGCCCVCNPLYSFAFILYLISCALWKKRDIFRDSVIKIKSNYTIKTQKKKKKNKPITVLPDIENYNCFFCKNAIIYSFVGICLVVLIAAVFFFSTGGTIHSIFKNIPNLINSSEYNVLSGAIFSKVQNAYYYFNQISLNMPFMIPLLYLFLIFDKKRTENSHRLIYLISALSIGLIYMFGIFKTVHYNSCIFSLPFTLFSNVCYILTEKKAKRLFYCMWVPGLIAALFQFISANTLLASLGIVLAINNIAGVFFVRDLFTELKGQTKKTNKNRIIKPLLCTGICIQIIFQCIVFQYEQLPDRTSFKATKGPYAGIIMSESTYDSYNNRLSDLEFIKSVNTKNNPILILSYQNWMNMYTEADIANYTTWRQSDVYKIEQLIIYYKENPKKIPTYIYIDKFNFFNEIDITSTDENINLLKKIFKFSKEELSSGVLLTVTDYNFELSY